MYVLFRLISHLPIAFANTLLLNGARGRIGFAYEFTANIHVQATAEMQDAMRDLSLHNFKNKNADVLIYKFDVATMALKKRAEDAIYAQYGEVENKDPFDKMEACEEAEKSTDANVGILSALKGINETLAHIAKYGLPVQVPGGFAADGSRVRATANGEFVPDMAPVKFVAVVGGGVDDDSEPSETIYGSEASVPSWG
ncbi:hypothetical protein FLONG3_9755 [Fusarium longipes]|uniref:Uncharacterized protein n=1 Tax=Fusarium longipes TaxID=694270 RepID=A0A395RUS7_9HYPO|nr:hypothetical protein FLONG3_9755 [Fusarium longipes]